MCCVFTGVAGEQQSAPRPVDCPRGWDGARGRPLWRRSARGVRRGEEKLAPVGGGALNVETLKHQCLVDIQCCTGTSLQPCLSKKQEEIPAGSGCQ